MTNVINLNILNVFGQQINKKTVNNYDQDRRGAERKKSWPEPRTIDVTPSKAVESCNNLEPLRIREIPTISGGQPEVLTCYPKNIETHDLKAYSSDYATPKGTHIDSYV